MSTKSSTDDNKSASALRTALRSFKARDLPPVTKVIDLDSSMVTLEAAKCLWEHNILGAPVWDGTKMAYVGFFDMRDILSAFVACAKSVQRDDESNGENGGDDGDKASGKGAPLLSSYNTLMAKELTQFGKERGLGDLATISYLAARNHFHSCRLDATLEELCQILVTNHCHRVPIINGDSTGRCKGIVSQSALVKFLSKNVSQEDLSETLEEAGLDYRRRVISVLDSTPAGDAFGVLDSHRLSGIAVVDQSGKLVGNTSARDIKLAALDGGHTAMDEDIISYLASVRQAEVIKISRYPSCHVHEYGCTVGRVVNLLAKTGYHRVFVVDEDLMPVGVVSVSDILAFAIGAGGDVGEKD